MKNFGFGLMRLPLLDKRDATSIDEQQLCKMVDYFLEQGFTYFDTAYFYHQNVSELATKKALVERHPRESYLLADKMPTFLVERPEDYQKYFEEQLEKCGVDYFDYYLLHTLKKELYEKTKEYGGFAFGQKLKDEGKIRHFGFSFHDTPEVLDQILMEQPSVEFVQLQINYIDWESEQVRARECYEAARKHGKPIIVMEPVRGGGLATVPEEAEKMMKAYHPELSIPSWAIRFAASLDGVMMVLSGMSDMAQLEDNTSYMRDFVPLNVEEKEIIQRVSEVIRSRVAVPCTSCRYCVDDCPKHIPIPEIFSLYNERERTRDVYTHKAAYEKLVAEEGCGKASQCIKCKQCEGHCPQHIEITKRLEEAAQEFE